MGDPRKHRKKFERPPHPWQGVRIEKEKVIVKKYGLVKKKEIWKMESILRKFKHQAKSLTIRTDPQSKKEEELLLKKLYNLGLLEQDSKLENILDLSIDNLLNRRLQTMVQSKGLARTQKQARQFVVHRHVMINNKKVTIPSYLVKRTEEDKLTFNANSTLSSSEHPERTVVKKEKSRAVVPLEPKTGKIEKTPIVIEAS